MTMWVRLRTPGFHFVAPVTYWWAHTCCSPGCVWFEWFDPLTASNLQHFDLQLSHSVVPIHESCCVVGHIWFQRKSFIKNLAGPGCIGVLPCSIMARWGAHPAVSAFDIRNVAVITADRDAPQKVLACNMSRLGTALFEAYFFSV